MAQGDVGDLDRALRSVRIEPHMGRGIAAVAKQARVVAEANYRGLPGRLSKSKAKLSLRQNRSVELSGLTAIVAEYGMTNRSWPRWGRGRTQRSSVPPDRFGPGRPKPEDGHVVGKAYKLIREEITEHMADEVWQAYSIQLDRGKIYKVKGI